jgi:hypothetical protein
MPLTTPRKRNMTHEEFKKWFYSNVTITDSGCWEWNGCRGIQGYGVVRRGGKNIRANRLSLEFKLQRKIEDGLLACHLCNNPPCCNPDHLKEGTLQDNMDDKVRADRQPKGEINGNSKLTELQVIEIKSLKCIESSSKVADRVGVKKACILKIWRNEKWAHVK